MLFSQTRSIILSHFILELNHSASGPRNSVTTLSSVIFAQKTEEDLSDMLNNFWKSNSGSNNGTNTLLISDLWGYWHWLSRICDSHLMTTWIWKEYTLTTFSFPGGSASRCQDWKVIMHKLCVGSGGQHIIFCPLWRILAAIQFAVVSVSSLHPIYLFIHKC